LAKIKDTDYLFLSTRIRALERSLLSRDRMERMLDASSVADAAKVLQECGYPEVEEVTVDSINKMLADARERTYDDLYLFAPDRNIIDVFKVKYDYHNAKVLLKSEARGVDAEYLLVDTGRVPPEELVEKVRSSDFRGLPGHLSAAINQARDTLGATGDPQLSDFVLDQAYFEDMFDLARASESDFLAGYVRINIDAANLKSVVRTLRMGKDVDFLKGVLFSGGNLDVPRILNAVNSGSSVEELYTVSALHDAAEAGTAAMQGGDLTRFEKLCDDAVMKYIGSARYVAFGEAPLVAYLAAKESEATAIRIIMTGRLADLSADVIRERLREPYV
jgi:V/A-type H+/Na+-transporting ATPase subunit C